MGGNGGAAGVGQPDGTPGTTGKPGNAGENGQPGSSSTRPAANTLLSVALRTARTKRQTCCDTAVFVGNKIHSHRFRYSACLLLFGVGYQLTRRCLTADR